MLSLVKTELSRDAQLEAVERATMEAIAEFGLERFARAFAMDVEPMVCELPLAA